MVSLASDGRPLKVYYYNPIQQYMKKDMGEDDLKKLKSILEEGSVTYTNSYPGDESIGYPGTRLVITVDRVCVQAHQSLPIAVC